MMRLPVVRSADYVARYAKKEDAMPKRGMMEDSDSEEGSDAEEGNAFLSSSDDEDEDQAAGHLDR